MVAGPPTGGVVMRLAPLVPLALPAAAVTPSSRRLASCRSRHGQRGGSGSRDALAQDGYPSFKIFPSGPPVRFRQAPASSGVLVGEVASGRLVRVGSQPDVVVIEDGPFD